MKNFKGGKWKELRMLKSQNLRRLRVILVYFILYGTLFAGPPKYLGFLNQDNLGGQDEKYSCNNTKKLKRTGEPSLRDILPPEM